MTGRIQSEMRRALTFTIHIVSLGIPLRWELRGRPRLLENTPVFIQVIIIIVLGFPGLFCRKVQVFQAMWQPCFIWTGIVPLF